MRFHRAETVRQLPHAGRGFTQGLILDGGTVWESTGLYGRSSLRRYRLGAELPDWSAALPGELFGEGICLVGDVLWQLTWQERVALCWQLRGGLGGREARGARGASPPQDVPRTLSAARTVPYNREGWGICNVGRYVVTSDGSSELVLREPRALRPEGMLRVRCDGLRVDGLNDLEWCAGRVWANVGATGCLVGVDPATGEVTDLVDARALAAAQRDRHDPQSVMNGIAAVPGTEEFLVTGKGWRFIHQVRLVRDRKPRRADKLLAR